MVVSDSSWCSRLRLVACIWLACGLGRPDLVTCLVSELVRFVITARNIVALFRAGSRARIVHGFMMDFYDAEVEVA